MDVGVLGDSLGVSVSAGGWGGVEDEEQQSLPSPRLSPGASGSVDVAGGLGGLHLPVVPPALALELGLLG